MKGKPEKLFNKVITIHVITISIVIFLLIVIQSVIQSILLLSGLGLILLLLSISISFIFLNRKLGVPLAVMIALVEEYNKNPNENISGKLEDVEKFQPDNEIDLIILTFKDLINNIETSKENFRLMFNNAPIGICINDFDGNFITVNNYFEALTGYSKEELTELTFYDITHPDDCDLNKQIRNDCFEGEKAYFDIEKRYIRKDNSIIDIHLISSMVYDKEDKPLYDIAVVKEITKRKKQEYELQQLRNYLSNIIDSMPSVLIGVDAGGKVTLWNRKAEERMGLTTGEACGQPLSITCLSG